MLLDVLAATVETAQASMAAAIAVLGGMACAIGEGLICMKAVEGVSRNPEAQGKIRSTMIFGCALTETTGIYALVVSLLIIFFQVL